MPATGALIGIASCHFIAPAFKPVARLNDAPSSHPRPPVPASAWVLAVAVPTLTMLYPYGFDGTLVLGRIRALIHPTTLDVLAPYLVGNDWPSIVGFGSKLAAFTPTGILSVLQAAAASRSTIADMRLPAARGAPLERQGRTAGPGRAGQLGGGGWDGATVQGRQGTGRGGGGGPQVGPTLHSLTRRRLRVSCRFSLSRLSSRPSFQMARARSR